MMMAALSIAIGVSIRFEVRGGFRPTALAGPPTTRRFQSALRFAVVSDDRKELKCLKKTRVSIRFEVRGGFRPLLRKGE